MKRRGPDYSDIDALPIRHKILQAYPTDLEASDRKIYPKNLCGTEANTRAPAGKLTLEVHVQGHRLNALINSGAMENYISQKAVKRCYLLWKQKHYPYPLNNLKG